MVINLHLQKEVGGWVENQTLLRAFRKNDKWSLSTDPLHT